MKLSQSEAMLIDLAISAAIRALFQKLENMSEEEVLAEIKKQQKRKAKLMAQL